MVLFRRVYFAYLMVIFLLIEYISVTRTFALLSFGKNVRESIQFKMQVGNTHEKQNYNVPLIADNNLFTANSNLGGYRAQFRLRIGHFLQVFTNTELFFKRFIQPIVSDPDIAGFTIKSLSIGFWVFLSLVTLGTVGIDTKPLISLLSVAGITVGFAAKDILTNSFAGLYILLSRPFQRGDFISVDGYKGKVISIDLRYVKLLSEDEKTETLVPISLIYRNAISLIKE